MVTRKRLRKKSLYGYFSPGDPPETVGYNLQVSDGYGEVYLNWLNIYPVATGYVLERSTDGVNFSEIGTTSTGVTDYVDDTVEEGVKYYYRVRSYTS